MNSNQSDDRISLNFEEWAELAENNPEEFEARRLRKIEVFFNGVPPERQQRLKGLQWQVDQARKLAHSPLASCIAISSMMLDSVGRLSEHQNELVSVVLGKKSQFARKAEPVSATVLPMPSRTH
jgi:hypothetical protein